MKAYTERGALVLADISGFTEFLTRTELEHGPPIIAELLEAVMRELSPPMEIQEVEGDAIFALGPDRTLMPPGRLLDALDRAFAAFRHRQLEMQADESCSCRVCRSVAQLALKIVAHHGAFLRHVVGGHPQVAGTDVILAHRLLKNGLGLGRAYLMVTEAALRWLEIEPNRLGLAPRTERYDHLGDVRCFVKPMPDEALTLDLRSGRLSEPAPAAA